MAGQTAGDLQIRLINTLGQVIETRQYHAIIDLKANFDLSALSSGLYYVEFRSGKERNTKKLIVNR